MTRIDLVDFRKGGQVRWLTELFQQPIRAYDGTLKANHLPVLLISGFHLGERKALFHYLDDNAIPFVLVHTSDENYSHDIAAYSLANCQAVFREYFRFAGGPAPALKLYLKSLVNRVIYRHSPSAWKDLRNRLIYRLRTLNPASTRGQCLPALPRGKVFSIPLGYLDQIADFARDDQPSAAHPPHRRPYVWSFYGDISKRDRTPMIQAFEQRFRGLCHGNSTWMGEEQASQLAYWQSLTSARFIPCPMGYVNLETARVYEAMEAGAIPLVLRSHATQPYPYFEYLWGQHPVPAFNHWNEAIAFVASLSDDDIDRLASRIQAWYSDLKTTFSRQVRERVNRIYAANQPHLPDRDVQLPLDRFHPASM